jgi:hypothetical protein
MCAGVGKQGARGGFPPAVLFRTQKPFEINPLWLGHLDSDQD